MTTEPRLRIIQLCVLLLSGAALALYAQCVHAGLFSDLHPGESTVHGVVAVVALALACGLTLPPMLARALPEAYDADPPDGWRFARFQVVSAAALIFAGGAMIGLGYAGPAWSATYRTALIRFHWTTPTLQLFELVLMAAYVALPVGLLALAIHCDFRRAVVLGSPPGPPVAALLAGVALALGMMALRPQPFMTGLVAAGVCLLIAAVLGSLLTAGRTLAWIAGEVPARAGTGTARLYAAMIGAALVTTLYIMLMWRIQDALAIRQVAAGCVGAVALGVLSVYRVAGGSVTSGRIGALAVVTAGSAVAVAALASRLPLAPDAAWWWAPVVGGIVLLPPWLGGVVIGGLARAIAERSARPRPRTLCAIGLGCAAAQIVLMPEPFGAWQPFDWMLLIVLAWFVGGGLILTLDPAFVMARRWPALAGVVAAIAAAAWILPRQAAAWDGVWYRVARTSTARAAFVSTDFEAVRFLEAMPEAALPDVGSEHALALRPFGAVLRDLRLDPRRLAAVALFVGDEMTTRLTDPVLRSLLGEIQRHLRPDGMLIIGVVGEAPEDDWAACLAPHFAECSIESCPGGLCVVGYCAAQVDRATTTASDIPVDRMPVGR